MNEHPLSFLLSSAEKYPDAICFRTPDKTYTYAELLELTQRRAMFLSEKGVGRGSLVTIQSRDYVEFTTTMFACWMLGAILAPLNTGQPPRIHRVIDGILKPDIGFHDGENPFGYKPQYPIHPLGLSETRFADYAKTTPDELSMIMFTSGTSGVPKGVPWKLRNTYRNAVETAERVEELLLEFDMFDEVAVVPEFDQNMGNVPVLYYVLHESCTLSRRDIVIAIRERLPKTHIPVRFYQASKLPRTQSGKIVRKADKLEPFVIK